MGTQAASGCFHSFFEFPKLPQVLFFVLLDCVESNKMSNSLVSKLANPFFFFTGLFMTVRLVFNTFRHTCIVLVAHTGTP